MLKLKLTDKNHIDLLKSSINSACLMGSLVNNLKDFN